MAAPLSWAGMALNRYYTTPFSAVVPAALTAYDLPDLAACLAPRDVLLVSPVDHMAQPVGQAAAEAEWDVVRRAYAAAGAPDGLAIQAGAESGGSAVAEWLSAETPFL